MFLKSNSIFAILCTSVMLVSCGEDNKSVDIATTIFPFRQIVEKITGPGNTVYNLMPANLPSSRNCLACKPVLAAKSKFLTAK